MDRLVDFSRVEHDFSDVQAGSRRGVQIIGVHTVFVNGIEHAQALRDLPHQAVAIGRQRSGYQIVSALGIFLHVRHGHFIALYHFAKAPLPIQEKAAEGVGGTEQLGIVQLLGYAPTHVQNASMRFDIG